MLMRTHVKIAHLEVWDVCLFLVQVNCRCQGGTGFWVPLCRKMTGYSQVDAVIGAYLRQESWWFDAASGKIGKEWEREQREWGIPLISDYFNLESNIDICRICRRARETRFGRMFFPNWRDWTLTGGFRCTAQHADIFDVWRHHSLDLLRRASHHWYGDARAWGCPWLIIVYRCCPECGAG